METFGVRLQKYRQNKKISQEEMGKKIGLSRTAYAALEQGITARTFSKLPGIAKALGCQIDDLFPEMDDVQKEAPQAQPGGDQLPGRMDMDDIDTWGD